METVHLSQALAKSRLVNMDSTERTPHKDLEHKTVCLFLTQVKAHITACMEKICARNWPIAIPWAMEAKVCTFSTDVHACKVTDVEDQNMVKYRTRAKMDFNGFVRFFHTLLILVHLCPLSSSP